MAAIQMPRIGSGVIEVFASGMDSMRFDKARHPLFGEVQLSLPMPPQVYKAPQTAYGIPQFRVLSRSMQLIAMLSRATDSRIVQSAIAPTYSLTLVRPPLDLRVVLHEIHLAQDLYGVTLEVSEGVKGRFVLESNPNLSPTDVQLTASLPEGPDAGPLSKALNLMTEPYVPIKGLPSLIEMLEARADIS